VIGVNNDSAVNRRDSLQGKSGQIHEIIMII